MSDYQNLKLSNNCNIGYLKAIKFFAQLLGKSSK